MFFEFDERIGILRGFKVENILDTSRFFLSLILLNVFLILKLRP